MRRAAAWALEDRAHLPDVREALPTRRENWDPDVCRAAAEAVCLRAAPGVLEAVLTLTGGTGPQEVASQEDGGPSGRGRVVTRLLVALPPGWWATLLKRLPRRHRGVHHDHVRAFPALLSGPTALPRALHVALQVVPEGLPFRQWLLKNIPPEALADLRPEDLEDAWRTFVRFQKRQPGR